ncbi:MAG: cadherin-like beta sandwich domain-containing protein, partial [Chloroflexi bacterium]|nr:cadherin-like beta sandwich domain-containing protein [Chloroflexota bacterium]
MKRKVFIPVSALTGALLLALVAAMTSFVAGPDIAHAQTPGTGELSSLAVGGKQIAIVDSDGNVDNSHIADADIIRVSSGTSAIGVSARTRVSSEKIVIRYGITGFVSPGAGASVTAGAGTSGSVPLVAGANTDIAVIVKVNDADTTGTAYVVRVRRVPTGAASDADLSNLTLTSPAAVLMPGFKPGATSYTALVPYDVDDSGNTVEDTIVVTPTLSNTGGTTDDPATFEIKSNKDAELEENSGAYTVELAEGANVITVMVRAANVSTTKTYTLTVTRANKNASDNAELSSLTVGGSSVDHLLVGPNINPTPSRPFYWPVKVPNTTTSITAGATTRHPRATVALKFGLTRTDAASILAHPIASGNTVDLNEGRNYIAVQVTAEDGKSASRRFHVIVIDRAGPNFSNNANLLDIVFFTADGGQGSTPETGQNITLVPPVEGATNYTLFVPYGVDRDSAVAGNQIRIAAVGYQNNNNPLDSAFVRMSGENIGFNESDTSYERAVHLVTLGTGDNVYTITVLSADATVTKTYTLTVRRAPFNGLDDARLSALTVGGASVNLAGFTPLNRAGTGGTHAVQYSTRVPNTTSSIQITPTTMDSDAVAIVRTGNSASTAVTGAVVPDGNVPLNAGGTKTIAVQVTAANGHTERNYILSVERVSQSASDDADLSSLMVTANGSSSPATFLPALVPGTADYMISVPNDVDADAGANDDSIIVTAAPATGGMVMVTSDNDDLVVSPADNQYVVELAEGANVITIVSEAANAVDMKTYTLTVTRAAATASDDAGLSELTVHATGDPSMAYRSVMGPGAYLTNVNTTAAAANIVETGVSNTVYNVQVAATPANSGASVVIKSMPSSTTAPADAAAIAAVSADADGVVDVIVGAGNHIVVEVTAENGVAKAYYVLKVNRARASASDDAKLSVLT